MSRRSTVVIVVIVVLAVLSWFGGHALWNTLLAMHGRGTMHGSEH